jgi:hypothetical protein
LLPEGLEVSLLVFPRSDKLDADCRLALSGMKAFAAPLPTLDIPLLVKGANLPEDGEWRLMTNAEIVAYKKEHRE